MELNAIFEFIVSWKYLILTLMMIATAYWLYNNLSGRSYYKKYPIAKVMDELAASGELNEEDISKAISDIDFDESRQFQAGQFKQNIMIARKKKKTLDTGIIESIHKEQ